MLLLLVLATRTVYKYHFNVAKLSTSMTLFNLYPQLYPILYNTLGSKFDIKHL
uniref:Uncharacterized protein n=1 Tax=Arundo donax TaxID=35708 RepID=A0A0A8Y297_ARUDO